MDLGTTSPGVPVPLLCSFVPAALSPSSGYSLRDQPASDSLLEAHVRKGPFPTAASPKTRAQLHEQPQRVHSTFRVTRVALVLLQDCPTPHSASRKPSAALLPPCQARHCHTSSSRYTPPPGRAPATLPSGQCLQHRCAGTSRTPPFSTLTGPLLASETVKKKANTGAGPPREGPS